MSVFSRRYDPPFRKGDRVRITPRAMAYFKSELPDTPQFWLQGVEGTVRSVSRCASWWNVSVDWDSGVQTSLDHESHELVGYHRPSRYEVLGDT